MLLTAAFANANAQAPAISSISPSTVSVGGPNFTLTITGSGFAASSLVQVNGSNRQTSYVSSLQLTAIIPATDIAVPGKLNITASNTSSGVTQFSNIVQLTVLNAASPTLTSVSTAFVTQGVTQESITLVGSNFRPGAAVIISPPLAVVTASDGHTRGSDVTVLNSTVVNSNVMTALVSVSPTAVQGLRAVDVLNLDGTSTIDATTTAPQGSSQQMHITSSTSIGAPLSVLNMAMMHPRDGTVVMQGDDLSAAAVLAGTGTGTVLGEWVWDGNVVEQFSANIIGGQSTTIQTRQSLPTWLLGAHTLQLRMLQPHQTTSRPIQIVVNPGNWKLEKLILPAYGASFDANTPPHLLWATVPGAMKYQVGFSSRPYFSTISQWFDVAENQWQVPMKLWQSQPMGQLYWTVRTIDPSGQPRPPLPMRVLYRIASHDTSHPSAAVMQGNHYRLMDAKLSLPTRRSLPYAAAPDSASTAAVTTGANDAEAPPAAAPAKHTTTASHPTEDGQIGLNTQWASGSNPPDSNVISVAQHFLYQQGPWQVEVNGSGLLNSILNAPSERTSQGKINNYVFQFSYLQKTWSAHLSFGIVTPTLFSDAQYLSEATARQGAQLDLKTKAGTFSGFANTDDAAAGGGPGISVHQRITAASWQLPMPQWAQLRLMWLSTEDLGGTASSSAAGDVYGGLLNFHLTHKWMWASEYAVSHDNPNTSSATSMREFGRAWRTGVTGQAGISNLNISYRDVSANFGNPTNPGLTPSTQPNVRGVNAAITQALRLGTFGFNYTFLANNVRPTTSDELLLNTFDETWSKPLNVKTNLAADLTETLTKTGTVPASLAIAPPSKSGAQDMRDINGKINLSRQVGTSSISIGGQRDWSHNTLFPASSTITSSLNVGANLVTKTIFQLNSQASVNWVAADGITTGTSRNISLNLQPAIVWKRPTVNLAPTITVTQGQTVLANGTQTNNILTGQYGGRVAWTLPGTLKFNTLSAQGSYNQSRNNLTGINQPTTMLLVILTTTLNHKHTL